ncbi:hypothetical protein CWC46_21500 [Prodigiosinella confusarubida]|uniref:Transposase n=1 Tax=Serratia sp. (strain ATCC 39006) TaxID=104623 RepID=A0A2I5TC31_SERS3|nr:hypothetical protein CWC46_21500 [Serratia sp. ATCC 39006]AUH06458.1 hypothetical protein Ser39006_021490 [Serratia sp. ATCC 39006]
MKRGFSDNKLYVCFFVIHITKKLTAILTRCIFKTVNSITKKLTKLRKTKMKLLNKIIAMFENITVSFGTFNN